MKEEICQLERARNEQLMQELKEEREHFGLKRCLVVSSLDFCHLSLSKKSSMYLNVLYDTVLNQQLTLWPSVLGTV